MFKKLFLAAALIGATQAASAMDPWQFNAVSAEFGTGNKTQIMRVGIQSDWNKSWWQSNGTHINAYWDVTLASFHGNQYRNIKGNTQNFLDIGLSPVFRFESDSKKGWYAEGSIGYHYFADIYDTNHRTFSTKFEFGDHLGAGYVFSNGMEVALKVQHFSNGAYKKPNPGANFAVLKVAKSF